MLDQIKEFFSNNTIMVVFAAVALLAIVGMFLFKPKSTIHQGPNGMPENTINNMMGGCDMNTGMCYPQHNQNDQMGQTQQMTPEMQDQMMQDQMMQDQMMEEQMMQEQMQQQEEHHRMQEQQMMEEQEMTPEMLQMVQAQ
jgi:hypothetical protein